MESQDRSDFMDVLIALFRKFEAGEVRTGFAWKDFPNNPVKSIQHAVYIAIVSVSNLKSALGQTMDEIEVEKDSLITLSPLTSQSQGKNHGNKIRGRRSRQSMSTSPIRKQKSRSPVKQSTSLDKGVSELLLSTADSPSHS
jgi:hypothetical protein